ncbi:hypothetical protein PPACK8108_LOCUS8913 [Phakopsora pachyrhizi]|uniref:Uncharacterized protein n=1 Tax=Phakopsora pachyrhizi TaxID=170000 RepID=A0AAV0AW59_PHAPC|nr:hypothetical protein PPACK8108_LOCUS8913 [Phakopsora pachyrhizi]
MKVRVKCFFNDNKNHTSPLYLRLVIQSHLSKQSGQTLSGDQQIKQEVNLQDENHQLWAVISRSKSELNQVKSENRDLRQRVTNLKSRLAILQSSDRDPGSLGGLTTRTIAPTPTGLPRSPAPSNSRSDHHQLVQQPLSPSEKKFQPINKNYRMLHLRLVINLVVPKGNQLGNPANNGPTTPCPMQARLLQQAQLSPQQDQTTSDAKSALNSSIDCPHTPDPQRPNILGPMNGAPITGGYRLKPVEEKRAKFRSAFWGFGGRNAGSGELIFWA